MGGAMAPTSIGCPLENQGPHSYSMYPVRWKQRIFPTADCWNTYRSSICAARTFGTGCLGLCLTHVGDARSSAPVR